MAAHQGPAGMASGPAGMASGPAGMASGPVGMVGTGNMGGRMTRRMVEAGHDVLAVDGPGTLTAFRVSNALGYGDMISNRVVDALGDLPGGVRVTDQED